jgi:hypothetical protein
MIDQEKYINLLYQYFDTFNKKDVESLGKMFSENVLLKDWNVSEQGKEEVLKANANIFNECPNIHVSVIEIFQEVPYEDKRFACELSIKVGANEYISVMDIISFNEQDEIEEISAYKQ